MLNKTGRALAGLVVPALLVAGVIPVAAAASHHMTDITVWDTFAAGPGPGQTFAGFVKQFNATHPSIHVSPQYITVGDNFLPKLMTAIAGNQEPDMIAGGYPTWGPGLLPSGRILPLNSFLDHSKTLRQSSFYPAMLGTSTYRKQILSIPYDNDDYGLFYNRSLFQKAGLNPNHAPQTWAQVLKDALQIKQKTGKFGFYVPIGSTEWTVWIFRGLLQTYGGTFIDTSGPKAKVEFNSSSGVKALQTWVDLIHKYHVAPNFAYPDTVGMANILEKGQIAMLIDGPWDVSTLLAVKFPLGVGFMPKGTANYATQIGPDVNYIFKTGAAKEQASWTFLEWLMSAKNEATWMIQTGNLPTTTNVVATPAYKAYLHANPLLIPFVREEKYSGTLGSLISYSAISAEFGQHIEEAMYGRLSAKAALNQAAAEANQILASNHE